MTARWLMVLGLGMLMLLLAPMACAPAANNAADDNAAASNDLAGAPADEAAAENGAEADDASDDAANDDAMDEGDEAEGNEGESNEAESDTAMGESGAEADEAGQGRGMAHRRHQDEHHQAMLDEAVAMGLVTEDDAAFFMETHEILDETSPRPMDNEGGGADSDTKKQLQRGRTDVAVAEGALSQEDADRFTEIHDILIDNGLMDD